MAEDERKVSEESEKIEEEIKTQESSEELKGVQWFNQTQRKVYGQIFAQFARLGIAPQLP